MLRPTPISTRTDTLFPYTTLFRSMRAIVFIRELGAHRLPAIDTVPGFSGHVHGWQHGSARVVDDGLGMVAVLAGWPAVFPVHDRQIFKGGCTRDRKSTRLNSSH